MRKLTFHIAALLLFCSGWMPIYGQYDLKFTQNDKPVKWKLISSAHFDIYFHQASQETGELMAKYAEIALSEINETLDYRNRSRYSLYFYPNADEYIRSNHFKEFTFKTPGVTFLKDNIGTVIIDQSGNQTYQAVKEEVASLMLNEFYFGGGVQTAVQKAILLHTPKWYVEGLSAYLGKGWTAEDEMWMNSLSQENLVQYAIEGESYTHSVMRKSIWYFIAMEYGEDKLSEIFYMTRLTRSVESGIITVLGISLKTLTERWREFVLRRIHLNNENRNPARRDLKSVPIPKNSFLIAHAMHPQKNICALILRKRGIEKLVIYDIARKTMTSTDLRWGFITDQARQFATSRALSWNSTGQLLAGEFFHKGAGHFFVYDLAKKKSTSRKLPVALEKLVSLSPGTEKDEWLASGMINSSVDVFTLMASGQIEMITNDAFDNMHPVMSPDGQNILFSSTRMPDSVLATRTPNDMRVKFLDIYNLDLSSPEEPAYQVTHTPYANEIPMIFPSSFELIYLSDESGLRNLVKKNLFTEDASYISDWQTGISQLSFGENGFLASVPTRGKLSIYSGSISASLGDVIPLPTEFRNQLDNSLRKSDLELLKTGDKFKIAVPIEEETENDTSGNVSRQLKFYVFDEEDDPGIRKENKKKKLEDLAKKYLKQESDINFDSLELTGTASPKLRIATDYVSTLLFDYSSFRTSGLSQNLTHSGTSNAYPAFTPKGSVRLPMTIGLGIKDLEGNHKLSTSVRTFLFDFKNNDLAVDYAYLKYRTDFFASFTSNSRHFFNPVFQARYTSMDFDIGALYPITRFAAAHGRLKMTYIHRIDLLPYEVINPEETSSDLLPGAEIAFMWDKTKKSGWETFQGHRIDLSANTAFSTASSQLNFYSFRYDARKYLRLFRNVIFMGRSVGGMSFGKNPQQFMIGGVNNSLITKMNNFSELPLNSNIADYRFMEFITPMRGFQFNARNGSKYFLINLELRLQLSKMFARSLNTNNIYNFSLVAFFDVGTAWDTGNPFSQKNPVASDPIDQYPLYIELQTLKSPFLMAPGVGAQLSLLGYLISVDAGWGIEENQFQTPKIHLSFGKKF